ncbi:MAG: hypothetical protein ACJAU0_001818 [Flavobacteriales bacterium]|jgi:hypothetical protein
MNEAHALLLLGFSSKPDASELPDLMEEKVFEIRTYFLRQPVVPELFRSRIRKLTQLAEAASLLGLNYEAMQDPLASSAQTQELIPLLNACSVQMADLKLSISSTLNPTAIATLAGAMVAYQIQFEDVFFELTAGYPRSEEKVNAADALDVGELLFEHKKQNSARIQELISKERIRISARKARMK